MSIYSNGRSKSHEKSKEDSEEVSDKNSEENIMSNSGSINYKNISGKLNSSDDY